MPPSISHGKASLRVIQQRDQLTDEQFEILWEQLKLAYKGKLYGCDCVTKGEAMPCEHVMEALHDPALFMILKKEKELGHRGTDILRTVGDELAKRADPENPASYRPSKTPDRATDADPGSDAKRKVLTDRIKNGESVRRDGDVFDYWFTAAPEGGEEADDDGNC